MSDDWRDTAWRFIAIFSPSVIYLSFLLTEQGRLPPLPTLIAAGVAGLAPAVVLLMVTLAFPSIGRRTDTFELVFYTKDGHFREPVPIVTVQQWSNGNWRYLVEGYVKFRNTTTTERTVDSLSIRVRLVRNFPWKTRVLRTRSCPGWSEDVVVPAHGVSGVHYFLGSVIIADQLFGKTNPRKTGKVELSLVAESPGAEAETILPQRFDDQVLQTNWSPSA